MRTVTQQQITAYAPNANAVANARKISSGGGFVSRVRSEDDTFYMGECKGSGKSNYLVSADFSDEASPVFRCSCPSRQFPCKHSLALLFEISLKKEFAVGEIPEEIQKKREAKEKKKAGPKEEKSTAKRPGAGKAARTKKIKKQLEGLELLEKLVDGLMKSGLSTMGSVSLKTYRDLAKQLGDYYLPGPQLYLNRLILEMEEFQKDQNSDHYKAAVEVLKKLHSLNKKAVSYLTKKVEQDTPEADDDELYEKPGGIWKLEQLNALGLKKENARLIQMAFQVIYDEAGKEFTDIGYWMDVDTGEISCTCNYRPVKALKYIKQEDSCFALVCTPQLSYYPGGLNRRVRWEAAEYREAEEGIYRQIKNLACQDLTLAVKTAKNQLKNTLSEDVCAMLLSYVQIGIVKTNEAYRVVMEDKEGKQIELRARDKKENKVEMLLKIPDRKVFENQAMFGLIYYDRADHSMCMEPFSVVTEQGIIRLLY